MLGICGGCRWWMRIDSDVGQCRRYPPSLVVDIDPGVVSLWPDTKRTRWCGEWAAIALEGKPDARE